MKSTGARSSNELQRLDNPTEYKSVVTPVMATGQRAPFQINIKTITTYKDYRRYDLNKKSENF